MQHASLLDTMNILRPWVGWKFSAFNKRITSCFLCNATKIVLQICYVHQKYILRWYCELPFRTTRWQADRISYALKLWSLYKKQLNVLKCDVLATDWLENYAGYFVDAGFVASVNNVLCKICVICSDFHKHIKCSYASVRKTIQFFKSL